MSDTHYLGEFQYLSAAWKMFPNGAGYGDYITIGGVRYDWDESTNSWGEDPGDVNPALPEIVNHDIDVQGTVIARDGIKTADYIPNEAGANVDHAGNAEFRTLKADTIRLQDPITGKLIPLAEFIKMFKTELPPDWSEYTQIPQFDDVRILAFDPISDEKFYTTIGALKKLIRDSITAGGVGTGTFDIEILRSDEPDAIPTDNNVMSSLRTLMAIQSAIAPMTGEYLSRINDDTAEGLITFLKGLEIGNYTSGFLGGGGAFKMNNGISELEVDKLTVRMIATFFELVISKLRHIGGQFILTPASMKCIEVEVVANGYKCFFDRGDNNEVVQEFVVNDQARCQVFSGSGLKMYWRLVVEVGDDYIVLSDTDKLEGSSIPEVGDDIVQLGYRGIDKPERTSAMVLSTVGIDAPSFKQYKGIVTYTLEGKETTALTGTGNRLAGDTIFIEDKSLDNVLEELEQANKDYVDNIEIGGRNLFNKSKLVVGYPQGEPVIPSIPINNDYGFQITGTAGTTNTRIRIPDVISETGWWTVSCEVQGNWGDLPFSVNIAGMPKKSFTTGLATEWKRVVITSNVTGAENYVEFADIGYINFKVRRLKIERGNKATDWTPAPEDQKGDGSQQKFKSSDTKPAKPTGDAVDWSDIPDEEEAPDAPPEIIGSNLYDEQYLINQGAVADPYSVNFNVVGSYHLINPAILKANTQYKITYGMSSAIGGYRVVYNYTTGTPYIVYHNYSSDGDVVTDPNRTLQSIKIEVDGGHVRVFTHPNIYELGKPTVQAKPIWTIFRNITNGVASEWSEPVKWLGEGTPGNDGVTPHIGANGNWYIGSQDTGVPARGPAGGGRGIISIREQFYVHTSGTIPPGTAWTWLDSMPKKTEADEGKFLWIRIKTIFTDDSTPDYSSPRVYDEWGIKDYVEKSAYLLEALREHPSVTTGLLLSKVIGMFDINNEVTSYLNGNPTLNPNAFAAGVENFGQQGVETAKAIIRHDGSGQLAGGNIKWNVAGSTEFLGGVKSPFTHISNATVESFWQGEITGWANNFYENQYTNVLAIRIIPCRNLLNGQVFRIHALQKGIVLKPEEYNGFYENGILLNEIQLSKGDAIEMVCICYDNVFHSWDIIRRYKCRPYDL